ncbi:MAG: hypothetical protein KF764_24865 [Labilithrix sp.]|nr:hypothetical protein [Labilithrix sp.]
MKLARARLVFVSMGAAVAVLVACSSSEDASDGAYDGPRSACSTGPAYGLGTEFPELEQGSANGAPECVPRCGEQKGSFAPYGVVLPVSALPSGACAYDGEVCGSSAVRTLECPDGRTIACSLTPYACRCEGGDWKCYAGVQGASACVCTGPSDDSAADGGADAADDG